MLNQNAVTVNPVSAYYREGLSSAILSDEYTTDAEYSRMIIDAAPVEVIDAARYSVDTLGDIEGALEDFQAYFNTLARARVRVSERVKTGVRKLCYFVACVGIITKDRAAQNVENVDNYLASCDVKGARSMAETLAGVCNRYIVDFIAPAKRTRAAQDAAPAVETVEDKDAAPVVETIEDKDAAPAVETIEDKDAALSNEFGAYIKRIQAAADNMRAADFASEDKHVFLDTIDAAQKWTEEGYKSGAISAFGYSQFKNTLDREYQRGALAFKKYRRNVERCAQERAAIEREKIDPVKMNEQIELWAKEPQTRRSLLVDLEKHFNKVFRKRSNTVMAFKWGYFDLCAALNGISSFTIEMAADNLDKARNIVKEYNERGEYKELACSARFCARSLAALCANILHYNPENAVPVVETVEETPAETVEENNVEEINVEETPVEENTVEEIDNDDETSDDDAEETTEEKERALELVATSAVESLRRGVVPWRHLKSDMKTAPRSWDRLRPYSLNNTLIIESTPETHGARLLITLDRADVKDDDGKSVIDWTQYDDAGADVWQPKKFRVIPIKDDAGNIIKDDDGKILVTRKVSKYGKVTIHDAALFPWLEKKRAQKYAQLEKIVASEIKERDAKRAAILGAAREKWASNLAQIVKRFFDGTKLTTERSVLGQEIARAFIASRLGFDLQWNADAEKTDAARLLALCTQGDKKHDTIGHALQVVLKHVNKCVASILYQSQPTAIKPCAEKQPAPVVEEKQPAAAPVKNDDEEAITDALETFEAEATQAKYTCGLVHQDNARRAENSALLAIEEARKNKSVPDDALEIYSDRVERIHVDTAVALKEEAKRRYGAEWIDRHVTFC